MQRSQKAKIQWKKKKNLFENRDQGKEIIYLGCQK